MFLKFSAFVCVNEDPKFHHNKRLVVLNDLPFSKNIKKENLHKRQMTNTYILAQFAFNM